VLARAPEAEAVITAELDLDHLAKVRRELPSLTHVRLV
jgi:predicted amidohydrolase